METNVEVYLSVRIFHFRNFSINVAKILYWEYRLDFFGINLVSVPVILLIYLKLISKFIITFMQSRLSVFQRYKAIKQHKTFFEIKYTEQNVYHLPSEAQMRSLSLSATKRKKALKSKHRL